MDDFQLTEPIECKPTLRREGLLSEAHLKARKWAMGSTKVLLTKVRDNKNGVLQSEQFANAQCSPDI